MMPRFVRGYKVDNILYFRSYLQLALYLLNTISHCSLTIEQAIGIVNKVYQIVAESTATQADEIDTSIACRLFACDDIGWDVL